MAEQGPLSGQVLGGKYLLGELLGEGGFGMVYAGQHLLLDRPQAIKLLLEHYFSRPKFRERFLREARMEQHLTISILCISMILGWRSRHRGPISSCRLLVEELSMMSSRNDRSHSRWSSWCSMSSK